MPGLTIGELPFFTGTTNSGLRTILYSGNGISYQYDFIGNNLINYLANQQSLTNSVDTAIVWSNIDATNGFGQTGVAWSGAGSSFYSTASKTMVWDIDLMIGYETNSTGIRATYIVKNGVASEGTKRVSQQITNGVAGDATIHNISTKIILNPGDFIRVYVYQTSGGALNTGGATGGISSGYSNRISIKTY